MKIILDTDGTLTDFNKFIKDNAIPYFKNKYHMQVIYPDKLEIEEIFDIKKILMKEKNFSEYQAEQEMKEMLDKFWISLRFVQFSLFSKFRIGVTEVINDFIKQGHDVQVHTSRSKTCNQDLVGEIARKFTIWQYQMNGIFLPRFKFHFYSNDEEKIQGIIAENPQIVFDDKKEIIDSLNKEGIRTICINGLHNKDVMESELVVKVNEFQKSEIYEKMNILLGKRLEYYNREAESFLFFNKLSGCIPLILSIFNPIILNEHNLERKTKDAVIYAPNHRSTLDPLVITAFLKENVHWAALLRFFEGKDSIFNNSKNPLLCKITAEAFKKLEYFPIDRITDNPKANNLNSIKTMDKFLKIKSHIGIFAEGTTKRPEGEDFGTFDSAFLSLAKRNNALIQPITILWIKDLELKYKMIINFGPPFKVGTTSINDSMEYFLHIQQSSLEENKRVCNDLYKDKSLELKKK